MVGSFIVKALRNRLRVNLHQRTFQMFFLFPFLIFSLKGLASVQIDKKGTSELAEFIVTVSDLDQEIAAMGVLAKRDDVTLGSLAQILHNRKLHESIRHQTNTLIKRVMSSASASDLVDFINSVSDLDQETAAMGVLAKRDDVTLGSLAQILHNRKLHESIRHQTNTLIKRVMSSASASDLVDFINSVSDLDQETAAMGVLAKRKDLTVDDLVKVLENQRLSKIIHMGAIALIKSLIGSLSLADLLSFFTKANSFGLDAATLHDLGSKTSLTLDDLQTTERHHVHIFNESILSLFSTPVLVDFLLKQNDLSSDNSSKVIQVLTKRKDLTMQDALIIADRESLPPMDGRAKSLIAAAISNLSTKNLRNFILSTDDLVTKDMAYSSLSVRSDLNQEDCLFLSPYFKNGIVEKFSCLRKVRSEPHRRNDRDALDSLDTKSLVSFILEVRDLDLQKIALEILSSRTDSSLSDFTRIYQEKRLHKGIHKTVASKLPHTEILADLAHYEKSYASDEKLYRLEIVAKSDRLSKDELRTFFSLISSLDRKDKLHIIKHTAFQNELIRTMKKEEASTVVLDMLDGNEEKKAGLILQFLNRDDMNHQDLKAFFLLLIQKGLIGLPNKKLLENEKIKNLNLGEKLDTIAFLINSKRSEEEHQQPTDKEDLQFIIDAVFNYMSFLIHSKKDDLNITTTAKDLTFRNIRDEKFAFIIRKSHIHDSLLNNEDPLSKTKKFLEHIKPLLLMLTDNDILPGLAAELRHGLNEFNQVVTDLTLRQAVLLESKAIFKIYTCAGHGLISLRTLDKHQLIGLYPTEDTGDQYDRAIKGRIANEWDHYKLGKLAQCQRLVIPLNERKLFDLERHISLVTNNMAFGPMRFSFIGGVVSPSSILDRLGYKACSGCFNCVQFAQSCFEVVAPNAGNFMHHTRNMIIYALRDRFDKAAFSNLYSAFGSVYSGYRLALEWTLLNLGYSPRAFLAPDLVDYYIPKEH